VIVLLLCGKSLEKGESKTNIYIYRHRRERERESIFCLSSNAVEGAKHSAAFYQLLQDMYFISQIISPFAELEHLFYRPELFDPIGLEGSEAIGAENANHFMPRDHALDNTVESDLFALRSTLYELITGKAPYEDRSHESVENLFREGVFPDVDGLPKQMSPETIISSEPRPSTRVIPSLGDSTQSSLMRALVAL
jgi:hypothetical protein